MSIDLNAAARCFGDVALVADTAAKYAADDSTGIRPQEFVRLLDAISKLKGYALGMAEMSRFVDGQDGIDNTTWITGACDGIIEMHAEAKRTAAEVFPDRVRKPIPSAAELQMSHIPDVVQEFRDVHLDVGASPAP